MEAAKLADTYVATHKTLLTWHDAESRPKIFNNSITSNFIPNQVHKFSNRRPEVEDNWRIRSGNSISNKGSPQNFTNVGNSQNRGTPNKSKSFGKVAIFFSPQPRCSYRGNHTMDKCFELQRRRSLRENVNQNLTVSSDSTVNLVQSLTDDFDSIYLNFRPFCSKVLVVNSENDSREIILFRDTWGSQALISKKLFNSSK